MSFRKGSPRHRAAGTVFFVSMPTMAACAVYLGFTKHQMGNVFGGLLTFYLVGTAWATARRRDGETHGFDWIALLVALAVGAIIVTHGLQVATGQRPGDGVPPGMSVFLGSVALIAPRETFGCFWAAVLRAGNVLPGICGACVLDFLSRQDRFSWGPRTAR